MFIKGPPPPAKDKQEVTRGIIAGFTSFAIFFTVFHFFIPIPMPSLPTMVDRLVFTLRLQAFSCMCLIIGLFIVMRTRGSTTAIDPTSGKGEHLLTVPLRYNTNTMEQFLISFVGQLILSTYLTEAQMKMIPIVVVFFVVGRITFYVGYMMSPTKRAFGFTTTFLPTVIVWIRVFWYLFSGLVA